MPTITHKEAKNLLNDACTRYIAHNQSQLDSLMTEANTNKPSDFFDAVFGLGKKPTPGFTDWLKCERFIMKDYIYCLMGYPGDDELYREHTYEERSATDPERILDELQGLIRELEQILQYAEDNSSALYQQVKRVKMYDEARYGEIRGYDTPDSTKLYLALHQLQSLGSLIQALASHHIADSRHRIICLSEPREGIDDMSHAEYALSNATALCQRLEASKPIFDGYLKGVVVKELQEALTYSSAFPGIEYDGTGDEWVDQFESLYKGGHTQDILETQRESNCEYYLKLLSVISILVGVGIFTTIGLSIKRLHDTAGKSFNFFKPLSATLNEEISDIREQQSASLR